MTKAADRERADLQATRDRAHAERLRMLGISGDQIDAIAELLGERAEHVDTDKRKGWQTAGRLLRSAADHVAELTILLDSYPRTTVEREPVEIPATQHANLNPADGPVSGQISAGFVTPRTAEQIRETIDAAPDTDAKLNAAFAPSASSTVMIHPLPALVADDIPAWSDETLDRINGAFDSATPSETVMVARGTIDSIEITPVVHIIRASEGVFAYCPATSGQRAYRGAANCLECIDLFNDRFFPVALHARVVLLTGSRSWTDVGLIHDTLAGLKASVPGLVIRHGKCREGADAIAAAWCEANGVSQDPWPADWSTYGKAAGPMRNIDMINAEPRSETYVAFWDGVSRGTKDAIDRCEAAGIKGTTLTRLKPAVEEILFKEALAADPDLDNSLSQHVELADPARPALHIHDPRPRLAPAQVREIGMAQHRGADHRSHSQLSSYEGCGTQYALRHLDRSVSWWNVGGSTVHKAIETLNNGYAKYATPPSDERASFAWEHTFGRVVEEMEMIYGVPHEAWRAAARGAEAYDWWRVEGEVMVKRWATFLANIHVTGWRIAEISNTPVVEYAYTLPIEGMPVPDKGIIDVAFSRNLDGESEEYRIVDIKAGKSTNHEHMQVGGQYRWGLWTALRGEVPIDQISGVFWQARTSDILVATEWDYPSMCARLASMDAQERAGVYPPKPSWICKTCGVADLCPVGPTA